MQEAVSRGLNMQDIHISWMKNKDKDKEWCLAACLAYVYPGDIIGDQMSRPVSPRLSGESAVPELHGSTVLVTATSHLLLGGEGLPHDAAGEAPAVFHPEVQPSH